MMTVSWLRLRIILMMSDDDIELADGRTVPRKGVDALAILDAKWPGASLPSARPAIVAAVMEVLWFQV